MLRAIGEMRDHQHEKNAQQKRRRAQHSHLLDAAL
jgi:hypothetical protein